MWRFYFPATTTDNSQIYVPFLRDGHGGDGVYVPG